MDKRAGIRWTILLGALALTVAAIFFPPIGTDVAEPSLPAVRGNKPVATLMEAIGGDVRDAREARSDNADPFAPRGWVAAAPLPATAAPTAAPVSVASVDLTPAGPPELPFRFVGGFNDEADQVVYLARGEQSYVARRGDVIDNDYKVVGIGHTQIEFEHIPTGAKQALSFPAADN